MSQPFLIFLPVVQSHTECPCQRRRWCAQFPVQSYRCKRRSGGIRMAKVKQLTISLENQPGALARVAQVLADAKVNMVALLGSTSGTQGSVQVVVDNVNKAKKALGGAGLSYT